MTKRGRLFSSFATIVFSLLCTPRTVLVILNGNSNREVASLLILPHINLDLLIADVYQSGRQYCFHNVFKDCESK